jgi:hypothetical protein
MNNKQEILLILFSPLAIWLGSIVLGVFAYPVICAVSRWRHIVRTGKPRDYRQRDIATSVFWLHELFDRAAKACVAKTDALAMRMHKRKQGPVKEEGQLSNIEAGGLSTDD